MKKLLSLVCVAAIAVSCSSLKVYSDMDPNADFTSYKTFEYYGWAENSDQLMNTLDKDRVEGAFGAEFKKRGVSFTENKGAGDAVVALFITTEAKESTTAYTTHMGMGGYGGGWGYGYGVGYGGMGTSVTNYNTNTYEEGTLVVSLYDAKTKKLVWQSSGTGVVDDNPKNRAEKINAAVAKIMSKYPIEPTE